MTSERREAGAPIVGLTRAEEIRYRRYQKLNKTKHIKDAEETLLSDPEM